MRSRRNERKDQQLCSQVRDALEYALMETARDALSRAWVREVVPHPDAKSLMVIIEAEDLEGAREAIGQMKGFLRAEVAGAIHRKRTPELTFQVVPLSVS